MVGFAWELDHTKKTLQKTRQGASQRSAQIEQAGLAQALRNGKSTLLFFYSRQCSLCSQLHPHLVKKAAEQSAWLHITWVDSQDELWIPEMVRYKVGRVPHFVAIQPPSGTALCKSGVPVDFNFIFKTFEYMVGALRFSRCKDNLWRQIIFSPGNIAFLYKGHRFIYVMGLIEGGGTMNIRVYIFIILAKCVSEFSWLVDVGVWCVKLNLNRID